VDRQSLGRESAKMMQTTTMMRAREGNPWPLLTPASNETVTDRVRVGAPP
jgi:hypothetical protein